MTPKRLVLITRRYWPLVGGAERVMAALAGQFQSDGNEVRILTAKWENHWPAEIVHREVPVIRVENPRTRIWGTYRYIMAIKRWLIKNRDQYDAVLVSMLKHDAYAAIQAGKKTGKPVFIRAEGSGETGDCHFLKTARFGQRILRACRQAKTIIAPSPAVLDELLELGFDSEQAILIPNGVPVDPDLPSPGTRIRKQRQLEARRMLAESHPILNVDPQQPLVLYTGRLDVQKGLLDLVDAWKTVADRFPGGRLWLVGEGDDQEKIWRRIVAHNLNYQIIMPGSFDDVTELLIAADYFVLPSYQEGLSLSLLEAMAAGVPVIASNIPGNRTLLGLSEFQAREKDEGKIDTRPGLHSPETDKFKRAPNGIPFDAGQPDQLARALIQVIEDPDPANKMAENAQQFVAENFSLEAMARSHLKIIDSFPA